jgi:hypothetical protein
VKRSHSENEGEGSRSAARRYNEGVRKTVETGKVGRKAREAAEALNDPKQAKAMREAEQKGRRRAAGE